MQNDVNNRNDAGDAGGNENEHISENNSSNHKQDENEEQYGKDEIGFFSGSFHEMNTLFYIRILI